MIGFGNTAIIPNLQQVTTGLNNNKTTNSIIVGNTNSYHLILNNASKTFRIMNGTTMLSRIEIGSFLISNNQSIEGNENIQIGIKTLATSGALEFYHKNKKVAIQISERTASELLVNFPDVSGEKTFVFQDYLEENTGITSYFFMENGMFIANSIDFEPIPYFSNINLPPLSMTELNLLMTYDNGLLSSNPILKFSAEIPDDITDSIFGHWFIKSHSERDDKQGSYSSPFQFNPTGFADILQQSISVLTQDVSETAISVKLNFYNKSNSNIVFNTSAMVQDSNIETLYLYPGSNWIKKVTKLSI